MYPFQDKKKMFCLNWKIYTKLTWLKISWPGSSTLFWKFWRFWDLTSFWELTPNNCLVRNLSGLFILFTRKSDQRAPEHRIISRRFKFCLNQSFQFFPPTNRFLLSLHPLFTFLQRWKIFLRGKTLIRSNTRLSTAKGGKWSDSWQNQGVFQISLF